VPGSRRTDADAGWPLPKRDDADGGGWLPQQTPHSDDETCDADWLPQLRGDADGAGWPLLLRLRGDADGAGWPPPLTQPFDGADGAGSHSPRRACDRDRGASYGSPPAPS
jgi:hypothetical protein